VDAETQVLKLVATEDIEQGEEVNFHLEKKIQLEFLDFCKRWIYVQL
jgi:hypothetical protein